MPSSPQELLSAAEGLAAESAEPLLRAAVTQAAALEAIESAKEIFKTLA